MGPFLIFLGFGIGTVNLLVTAGYFFSNDQTMLGLIMLVVPPAELVLPWVASTTLGLVSLTSIVCLVLGSMLSPDD